MISFMRNLIVACAFMGTVGCSNVYKNVYTNYDKSVDFTQYTTFAWAPDSNKADNRELDNSAFDNDIVRNNAKNYITNTLTKRGYLVNIDSPDLLLQLVLLNEKKEKVVTYHTHAYGGYYYYSPFYFPYYYPYYRYYTWYGTYPPFWDDQITTYTKTYVKGTITINMFDRKEKKLVWTGSAEGDIYDPVYIHFNVHPAIDRIMKEFPIKPKAKGKRNDEWRPVVRRNDPNGNSRNVSSH
jgi:hypothetical protein